MAAERVLSSWFRGRPRPGTLALLAYLVFFGLVIWLSLDWLHQALPTYLPKDWWQSHEFDGLIDWKGARMYLRGDSPFSPAGLREMMVVGVGHPPTTEFWFLPIARFDKALASELIGLTTWVFLGIHLYVCGRELEIKAPLLWATLIFSWILTTQGMQMHWHAIQLSEHIALPLTLCWMYLRRGREIPAGIMLGIALCLKLFPGVLVLLLLVGGRIRAVVACTIVFVIASAVMTAGFGLQAWPLFFHQQTLISPDWIGHVRNASIQGIVLRLITPVCTVQARPSVVASVTAGSIAVVMFAVSWFASRRALSYARKVDPRAIDLPFALFSVLSVFANAWTWEHYSVLMLTAGYIVVVTSWRAFAAKFRAYLDELSPRRELVKEGLIELVTLLSVAAVIKMFDMDIYAKERLIDMWRTSKLPVYHHFLHFFEIINWLPWALMVLLCLGLVWYRSVALRPLLAALQPPKAPDVPAN